MSQQTISPPRIVAADHRATQRVPGQWRLEIMWRFENETDTPLYVLLDQPLTTTIGDPLILNHAAAEPSLPVEPNREADFEIITVSARDAHERRLQYHLALPEALEVVTVIGRFGYSHTPPDPAWMKNQNRTQVAKWQQIADSDALTVRFEKGQEGVV